MDAVCVDDGLGRVSRAVATAGALQRVVEAFENLGLQVAQANLAFRTSRRAFGGIYVTGL
jgi:hypothetical protein